MYFFESKIKISKLSYLFHHIHFSSPFQIFRLQVKILFQTPKFQSSGVFFANPSSHIPPRSSLPISSNIIPKSKSKVSENFKVSVFLYLLYLFQVHPPSHPYFSSPFRQTIFPGSVKRCSRRHVAVLGAGSNNTLVHRRDS